MNKAEFLNELKKTLASNKIEDIDEILSEYEQHFAFKLADGYSEEEIAVKLGDPKALANQFVPDASKSGKSKGSRAVTAMGLGFADIIAVPLFIVLFAWNIVMGAASVASLTTGVCLITNSNIHALIPNMPYYCAFVFAVLMFALAVLFAVVTLYCYLYFKQLFHAYFRWHKNTFAAASGKPVYPPLPIHPPLKGAALRRIRNITLIALLVLAVGFITAYIISAFSAGALEFWHKWGWFQ